jgi:L-aminopeptidase/D-esterase-like protein
VGKAKGYDNCTKGGQGTFSISLPNGLIVGALAAVNAFGEVADPAAGKILAGVKNDSGTGFIPTSQIIMNSMTMSGPASISQYPPLR